MLVTYARRPSDRLAWAGTSSSSGRASRNYSCYGLGFDLGAKYERLTPSTTVGVNSRM